MNPMETAPQDGTRILLKFWPYHYQGSPARWSSGYFRTPEPKWEECRWVPAWMGSEGHWQPWTGKETTTTTEHIRPVDTIGWMPVPC